MNLGAYLAALGLATPALLASSPTAAAIDAPLRYETRAHGCDGRHGARPADADDNAASCAAGGGRVGRAVALARARFPDTPCEGRASLLECARLIHASLLSTPG